MAGAERFMREHGILIAVLAVVVATLAFLPLRPFMDFAHLAWLYLCVVGLIAWSSGTRSALLAAVLSFIAGNYVFTPPFGTFAVAQPLDLIQLVVFLVGAATVGALTGRVREREVAAKSSEREATSLARLASQMAKGRDLDSVIDSAVSCLMSVPGIETVVVWIPEPKTGLVAKGPGARLVSAADRTVATRAYDAVKAINLPAAAAVGDRLGVGWPATESDPDVRGLGAFIPLVSSSANEGVLQVVGGGERRPDGTASLSVSISQLLAVFIASMRAIETATRVKGAEEATRVKAMIVSAVSHELKTPLAAAMAGVTDLASEDVPHDRDQTRRTLQGVESDLTRLQTAISDLLDLSRLQSDEWMPHPETYEAGEILGDVAALASSETRERLEFRVDEAPSPEVFADFTQVSRALRAILDNAIVYSPGDEPIFLGAERSGERTILWIEDRGPGVTDEDKPFIFDSAYKGKAGVRRPGSTGLGLTIARDLIEANGGHLSVEDASPRGTRIVADLPATPEQEG